MKPNLDNIKKDWMISLRHLPSTILALIILAFLGYLLYEGTITLPDITEFIVKALPLLAAYGLLRYKGKPKNETH